MTSRETKDLSYKVRHVFLSLERRARALCFSKTESFPSKREKGERVHGLESKFTRKPCVKSESLVSVCAADVEQQPHVGISTEAASSDGGAALLIRVVYVAMGEMRGLRRGCRQKLARKKNMQWKTRVHTPSAMFLSHLWWSHSSSRWDKGKRKHHHRLSHLWHPIKTLFMSCRGLCLLLKVRLAHV